VLLYRAVVKVVLVRMIETVVVDLFPTEAVSGRPSRISLLLCLDSLIIAEFSPFIGLGAHAEFR
jgi:hypothetical protein